MPMSLGIGVGIGMGGATTPVDTTTAAIIALLGANLLGFWDVERADLITQAAGLVSSDLDTVAAYNVVQATGARQPAYSATSLNNRPGFTFDGTDDRLTLASVPFPIGANAIEMWALVNQTALVADATTRCLFGYGGGASTVGRRLLRVVSGGANRASMQVGRGADSVLAENPSVNFSGIHVLRGIITGTTIELQVDGVAMTPVACVPGTTAAQTSLGCNDGSTQFFQGVGNAWLVTSALSAGQAASLLTILKTRGGVA